VNLMVKRFWILIMILPLFASDIGVHAEEKKLSLSECIEYSLNNQPTLKAAQWGAQAGSWRETQAASPYYPQISASTGYSESHSLGGAFGESVTKSYTSTLSVDQLLYDFGKTGNAYDAAKWGARSSQREMDRTVLEIVLNVKQAYFALLQAKQLVLVEQKTVEQSESHLKQAQAFFHAGSKPRFDVTRAEVDVNTARLGLINAQNNVRIRTIALNNAMGADPGKAIDIDDSFPKSVEVPVLDKAQDESLKNRPELLKADADIEAAKARVSAEESNYLPTLSANGAYNWANGTQDMGEINGIPLQGNVQNSWNAGVILSVPLFQGGLTRGRVGEARANLMVLEMQRDATRQSILLEVNQSYADLESAKVRIDVMESSLQKARESLEIAQGRYEAGIGPYIEVTDAQLSAVHAETDYIQAQYDYQLSVARLLKAMGVRENATIVEETKPETN
jgi:outer membrane protein